MLGGLESGPKNQYTSRDIHTPGNGNESAPHVAHVWRWLKNKPMIVTII